MSFNQYQKIVKKQMKDLLDSEIEHKNNARLKELIIEAKELQLL